MTRRDFLKRGVALAVSAAVAPAAVSASAIKPVVPWSLGGPCAPWPNAYSELGLEAWTPYSSARAVMLANWRRWDGGRLAAAYVDAAVVAFVDPRRDA